MRLAKLLIVAGAVWLIVAGALFENGLLGSFLTTRSLPGRSPLTAPSAPTGVAATVHPGTTTVGTGSPNGAVANVQSGAQSGGQDEEQTSDTTSISDAAAGSENAGNDADSPELTTPPVVTSEAAIKAALARVPGADPSTARVALEDENGQPVYQILFVTSTGHRVVKVNGLTGAAVPSEDNSADEIQARYLPKAAALD